MKNKDKDPLSIEKMTKETKNEKPMNWETIWHVCAFIIVGYYMIDTYFSGATAENILQQVYAGVLGIKGLLFGIFFELLALNMRRGER